MLRFSMLVVAIGALIPLGPLSCPPIDTPDDLVEGDRDPIVTAATAVDSATVGQTVALVATATPTADGGTIRYSWVQIAGPGVQITASDSATAGFVAPSLGSKQTLTFLVTTSNDAGDAGRATASVSVALDPAYDPYADVGGSSGSGAASGPVADAGADQNVAPGDTVTLDGSSSRGTALTYRWRQIAGTDVTLSADDAAETTFTAPAYDADGSNVLLFELAVTDDENRTVTDRVQVTVRDPDATFVRVTVATTMGDFVIELDQDKAPISVENFLQYMDDGFYTNTLFHRVIPNFVVQGGGFLVGLTQKDVRDPIVNEASNGLSNIRGTVAMARTSEPDSATSQWFVNVANNTNGGDGLSDLDPGGVSPEGYAVFGTVVEGMDVVDNIAAVATTTTNGMQDVPVQDVIIRSITRTP